MVHIYIKSEHLQLSEPLMEKYYDFHSSMFYDEIKDCVEKSGIDYKKRINGVLTVDFEETFRENKDLRLIVPTSYRKMISEQFSDYFTVLDDDSNEEEIITDDDIVFMCLTFMSYVYHKESEKLFQHSFIIEALDLEYESVLHHKIYPEMLSLYKIILEAKTKKNRGLKVTISYKQDKIDINSCAWFLDDMERMFKERFPNLNLDKINQLLPDTKGKAGRKFQNRIKNNIIWGTYQLLYNHHSKFKNSKTRISEEICQFIIDYLNYLDGSKFFLFEIRDWLKDMLKRGYTPQWDLPWRNAFSNIQEKQPENSFERLNRPRRYDLSNL